MRILSAVKDLLKQKQIRLIYTEVNFVPLYSGQVFFHDLCAFLYHYNYQLFNLYQVRRTPEGQMKWGDAIFIPDKF